ncbi:Ig-like domain-containing protein [Pseudothauera nasutitermitis]|uniref:Ig-like domain-containing protein n=1 Tax=Pseudothauera nasutitermitis TaxID=2565930 RepID=UPI001B3B1D2D|nr:type I secretion C-terminal target domain-containing protein [Pseudothauera nasutitermitis]
MSFEISDAGVGTLTGTSEHATSVSVTITGSDGSNLGPFPATLNPDGSWSVDLSGESFDEEVTYTATATATDNASNTATGSDTAGYDLLPTVGVSFEISDAGVGTLTGTSEHATSVSVTITGSDGSNLGPFPATLNPDGSWSVDLSGESFDEEVTYTATATATDNASNTATDTDTAGYDLLPTVGVSFEISDAGVGTLTGTSEHATSVSVTITGSDGSNLGPFPATLNPDGTWSVDLSGESFDEEVTYTATATATDNASNTATGSDTASYDLNAPPVAIDDPTGQPYSVSLGSLGSGWSNPDSNHSLTDLSAWKADGTAGELYQSGDMRGVKGSPRGGALDQEPDQLQSNNSGQSEAIELKFSGNLDQATFSVSHLYSNENGYGEIGRWVAYFDGVEVASGEFRFNDLTNSTHSGTFAIDTGGRLFNSVRFEAVHNGDSSGDSSGYFLTGFAGTGPEVANGTYLVSVGDTLNVSELEGILANDSDPENDPLSIVAVNGSALTVGEWITLPSGAKLMLNADGSFSYDTNNQFGHLAAGEWATDSFQYTISDGMGGEDTATVTVTVVGTGVPVDTSVTDGNEVISTAEDAVLTGNVLANTDTNVGTPAVSSFSVAGDPAIYDAGDTATISGVGTLTIGADGEYRFEPAQDYSGPVPTVTYTVTNGVQSDTSTLEITVTPVADQPEVSVDVQVAGSVVQTLTTANVLGTPTGFTVTAYKDGEPATLSVRSSGSPTGFGVAGSASDGASEEIGNGEVLRVQLQTAAESVSFRLAWLASGEYAKYVLIYTDGTSESVILNGNSAVGGYDQVGSVITRNAPAGKLIAAIEFTTPGVGEAHYAGNNDYLVYQVSYVAASSYELNIVATPTDNYHTESITELVVVVPVGITLSAGTHDGSGKWTLPLDGAGAYTVQVDPVTKEVSVSGLSMNVPSDFSGELTLTVTAKAADGTDTAEGSTSLNIERGTAGNDTLVGTDGADILIGGAGDDVLTGGLGADVFVWRLGDQGTNSQPATDRVTDFNLGQGDVLDLRDLLDGHSGSLDHYLKVEESSGNTVLTISTTGNVNASHDQVIVLDGVTGLIDGGLTSQSAIIQDLINKQAIQID